jgi:hypothetical protein
MPELNFQVETVEVMPYAVSPMLDFKLRIENSIAGEKIESIALRTQIQIEATRRRYSTREQASLLDLFGEVERWSQTLRGLLWTIVNSNVPAFNGDILANLPTPCSFDFNVAVTKYFYALEDGEIPLVLLFSGTIFYRTEQDGLLIAQVPWAKEASFRLPVRTWKEMMDLYYPNTAWLHLDRDLFDRLYHYKMQHGLPTWEQALERLLPKDAVSAPGGNGIEGRRG